MKWDDVWVRAAWLADEEEAFGGNLSGDRLARAWLGFWRAGGYGLSVRYGRCPPEILEAAKVASMNRERVRSIFRVRKPRGFCVSPRRF